MSSGQAGMQRPAGTSCACASKDMQFALLLYLAQTLSHSMEQVGSVAHSVSPDTGWTPLSRVHRKCGCEFCEEL